MRFCGGIVIDATTGQTLTYPFPREQAARNLYTYDLLVRYGDEGWLYWCSSNIGNSRTFENLARIVEGIGGIWRLVEAATGEIVRENRTGPLFLN